MIKRCNNGHWYDTSVHRACPHCKQESEKLGIRLHDIEEDDRTISIAEAGLSLGEELGAMICRASGASTPGGMESRADDDRTISFGFFGMTAAKPVTGWLVCLTGGERGRDYRLHAGKNFVGRSPSMDVVMVDDKKISREKHCSVIYDPKGNAFYLAAEGGNLVYLNGKMLESTEKLKEDDRITIGETSFLFIPFCRGKRTWEEKQQEEQ